MDRDVSSVRLHLPQIRVLGVVEDTSRGWLWASSRLCTGSDARSVRRSPGCA